jgi:hypothetical protein
MDIDSGIIDTSQARPLVAVETPKYIPPQLSKEAHFVSKMVSTCLSNGNSNLYKTYRQYYDQFLHDEIPKSISAFHESNTPISNPIIQLVFNLEDMFDDVYKRAKADVKLEILTEIEAVYNLRKRGESSSSDDDFQGDYHADPESEDNDDIVVENVGNHVDMNDLI